MMALTCYDRRGAWLKVLNRLGQVPSLLLILAIPACQSRSPSQARTSSAAWDSALPGVTDLEGKPVSSLSTTGSKGVVLIFVRTDCPIANHYAPEMERLYQLFAGRHISFWLVYPDADTSPAEIRRHLREYQLSLRAVRDPAHELVKRAGATVTPEAAIFLPGGREVYHGRIDDRYADLGKERPAATSHDLENAVAAVLQNRPVPPGNQAVGCYIADLAVHNAKAGVSVDPHP